MSFIDVVHVIFYPFLIWAAWILHRRNSRDAVSSILSLAILLMISSELPASNFLASIGVPRPIHVAMFDLGNVFLIAGILLFPHGKLSPKVVALVAASPLADVPFRTALRILFPDAADHRCPAADQDAHGPRKRRT